VELGPFHVHRGHAFEGFRIDRLRSGPVLTATCACGKVLDVAAAAFAACPECDGGGCLRCGGTGEVVDHAALDWRLPSDEEERDGDRT
jgi:hypothetical protein